MAHTRETMSRSRHHGCGKSCPLCRPWKHGFEDELRVSERRKLQDEGASEPCDSEDNVVGSLERSEAGVSEDGNRQAPTYRPAVENL